jgi:hypothetical protein
MSLKELYRAIIPERTRDKFYPLKLKALELSYIAKTMDKRLADHYLRTRKKRLLNLKGKYSGQRCFIMGNGPSLNQMDLNLLKNEYVWGSNRVYLLFDRIVWRPKFYVAVDRRVVPDNAAEINQLSSEFPDTLFFFPSRYCLENILTSKENTYWYNEVELNEKRLPEGAFSLDPAERVYRVNTVTIAALQLAVFLGFNPIYLIGCDTNYSIPPTVDYEDNNKNFLISNQDDDPNHFSPSYFGKGRKWHDPNVESMILHYDLSNQVCKRAGVKVYNATLGGRLEIFERVDFNTLF